MNAESVNSTMAFIALPLFSNKLATHGAPTLVLSTSPAILLCNTSNDSVVVEQGDLLAEIEPGQVQDQVVEQYSESSSPPPNFQKIHEHFNLAQAQAN